MSHARTSRMSRPESVGGGGAPRRSSRIRRNSAACASVARQDQCRALCAARVLAPWLSPAAGMPCDLHPPTEPPESRAVATASMLLAPYAAATRDLGEFRNRCAPLALDRLQRRPSLPPGRSGAADTSVATLAVSKTAAARPTWSGRKLQRLKSRPRPGRPVYEPLRDQCFQRAIKGLPGDPLGAGSNALSARVAAFAIRTACVLVSWIILGHSSHGGARCTAWY